MPDTPEAATPPITLFAFDFGLRRIGIAVGQQVTGSASPVGTARNGAAGPDWERIGRWIDEWRPQLLVVGMPWHADGSPSTMTQAAREFVAALGKFGLPVDTIDERYTSLEASDRLRSARAGGRRGRIRKPAVDAAAAVLIAERWLAQNN
jgi:putative Holliday junction resolvase